ncbi:MAG TPA: ABC transporter ATP-binding protein [Alphaproteobacteria bacterium]|jgi:branched-chain amino acid transport system ATP-binding protein|nr:ABC transporter ATP-binding protein [Alphaproteobacteria bacterium]
MADALRLADVSAGYGETVVLEGVSLTLSADSTRTVLGRNGVGKSTLLATIMGHTTLHKGEIVLAGIAMNGLATHARARAGIGYVPQEREIFPSLTVEENLAVAERPGRWNAARVYDLFPQIAGRRRNLGNQLSGGEQQMLAIGRALMGNPSLLLMDEPLEGLAPVIVDTLIAAFNRLRADDRLAILLVEQHARLALGFADDAAVLDRGRVVYDGPSRALLDDPQRLADLIGVAR